MADQAAIQYLLDISIEIVNRERDPRASDDDIEKVEPLTNDLKYFSAFLKYASSKKVNDERVTEFVGQIREALYDAQLVVETFVSQSLSAKSKNWFSKLYKDKEPFKLDGIAQKVHKVRDEVEKVFGDKLEIVEDGSEKIEIPPLRKKHVVGLEESANAIIGNLKEETEQLDIISIVGKQGIGKSTLARKVFEDPSIQEEFPMRLWVSVSKFTLKTVFLGTLTGFNVTMKDMHRYREYDLATLIKRHIDGKKFLIIFDDVRTPEDWSNITYSLPPSSNRSKVVITSRLEDVALKANPNKPPYKLDFLDSKESVQLLQYEVFGEPKWEPEFENHGKSIAEKCKGFPPAIEVLGGVIRKELSAITDHSEKVNAWAKFSERVHHLLADDEGLMEKVVSLSYESLPSHLKPFFLYFGMFPECVEIPTRKLFQMWTAEGFIQQRTDSIDPDEIAESYLRELISRNLVGVGKTSLDGRLKTCTVHVSVQDFCKKQGGEENFLHEVIVPEDVIPKPTDDDYGYRIQKPVIDMENSYHRLCIHSHIPVFAASKPMGRLVRTVVCTSMGDVYLPLEHIATISGGFKLIRVFDVKPIRFPKLPASLFDLLHLRFVHLNYDISSIPPAITRMWNIQTLIVEATVKTLEIRADIWKMRYLTHLKTNKNASLPAPKDETALAESKLETLSIIPPESLTDKVVDKLQNLKRVTVRGKLEKLLTDNVADGSFKNIAKLTKLEKLKLLNELPNENPLNSRLPNLPASAFPPNLRILTLSDTLLDWSQMKVIASLYNLEVLKLKKGAFTGETWETEDGGFVRLSFLFIGNMDLVNWKTSAAHFPALASLKLLKCEKLVEVPVEFAKIPSFKELGLNSCESAVDSAKEIKRQKTEADKAVEFKLTIVSST